MLKLSTENTGRAIKMFNAVLKYQSEGGDSPERLELVQKLLHQGLKRGELRDELFMQLLKQTRANPSVQSRARGWELLFLVASTMAPSKDFVGLVSQYIHDTAHDSGTGRILEGFLGCVLCFDMLVHHMGPPTITHPCGCVHNNTMHVCVVVY